MSEMEMAEYLKKDGVDNTVNTAEKAKETTENHSVLHVILERAVLVQSRRETNPTS